MPKIFCRSLYTVCLIVFGLLFALDVYAQTIITIDASTTLHPVSKYLYGRNNSLSDSPSSPLSASSWLRIKDSGATFLRESGGNNCTKYNWRRKLGSHPDWYNNVYAHDWDFAAKSLQQNLPGVQGMWAFQMLGKDAKTGSANFNEYAWQGAYGVWWTGVSQNLAGGGTPNPALWSWMIVALVTVSPVWAIAKIDRQLHSIARIDLMCW